MQGPREENYKILWKIKLMDGKLYMFLNERVDIIKMSTFQINP